MSENESIRKAKGVLETIAKGVDPLTGELIAERSFLNDPGIIRSFYNVIEYMDKAMKGAYNNRSLSKFVITSEQKSMVKLPENNIGVNEFSRCINECLDLSVSKRLTGVELNRQLKKIGVLSEETTPNGKTRTVTNDSSIRFGFESVKKEYNGSEYDMVVINDKGKKYLLEELETIMAS